MTNEEKAKAYDEALERAKDGLTDKRFCETEDTIRSVVEYIFPQLTESDDERIREEMIQYFTEMKKGGSAALPYDDCIAYLERQKEQKPANEQDYSGLNDLERAILRGFLAADVENVPVGIIKETAQDCLVQTGLIKWELPKDFEEAVYKVVNFVSPFSSEEELREISHRFAIQLLSLAKEEAQKSTWSEDDENMLYDIRENYKLCIYLCEGQIEWIESLKYRIQLQPKQEWSEEDENMLNSCISSIEEAKENRYYYRETDGDTSYDHEISWLKSLRPSWKPSEEQMKAIKHAYNSFPNDCSTKANLRLLYYDLEKLM